MSKVENTDLMKKIDAFVEIDESENKDLEKLAKIAHELDHQLLESQLITIVNNTEKEYSEILRLIVEDEHNSYFIPSYTDVEEAKKGIEELVINEEEWEYEFEVMDGQEILEIAIDDDDFAGIVINPYNTDFIFPKEDLITTAVCNQEHEGC